MIRFEQVRRWALQDGQRIALTWSGGEWSYRRLFEGALQFALELEHRGVRPGDRVALLAENDAGTLAAVLGIQAVGGTLVPINFRLTAGECDTILGNAVCAVMLFGESEAGLAAQITGVHDKQSFGPLGELPTPRSPQTTDWSRDRWPQLKPDSVETVIYTSGTTGLPKGVVTTPVMVTGLAQSTALTHIVGAQSCWLQVLPYFSAASLNLSLNTIYMVGGRLHLMHSRHFEAGRFMEEAHRSSATHTELVPTQLYRILDMLGSKPAGSTFQAIGYGSAPMSDARLEQALQVFGPIFIQAYGMTETTCQATLLLKEDHVPGSRQLQSAGRPLPHVDVMVARDDLAEVAFDEEGEICFRGITVTPGYWRAGAVYDRTGFDGDWLRSGDVGRVDDHGFIYVVDRKKDLVISGGFNVSSREVEDVIYQLDGVLECAVVGAPDKDWGEVTVATIVRGRDSDVDEARVIAHCKHRLAGFKVPQRVVFLDELPKNSIGKILKREIRKRLQQRVEA
ncbi:MAG: long-chain fatty acid--CoA ligase [Chloroflexi bacterium]|nr:MAG: long-chain fatty acid--CoA ligase [Chloroflexota bacterium]TMD22086.1 MAG: long-chain fatty acid--CoA ligase [Chloroflexota bacterium]TMF02311.1 MAG: long-chain fatty acid--CoA ligase [Chloroflexota bacterium]